MAWWDEEAGGRNPPIDVWRHARIALTFGGALAMLWALARDPLWVENEYVDGWGGALARGLSKVTGVLPFSVAEIVLMVGVVWGLMASVQGLGSIGRGRTFGNVLLHGLLRLIDVGLVLGAWFYLSWGMAYARPSAADRLGLTVSVVAEPDEGADTAALQRTLRLVIARTNAAYQEIHGSLDGGRVTVPPSGFDVDGAIEGGYDRAGAVLNQPAWFRAPYPATKKPFASVLMSYVGVAGIYVPFTGEATVDALPPAWSRVFTAAHEKAHQRMIASEDEASFFGFLACVHAVDPLVRYAGWQFARAQLFARLYAIDPAAAQAENDQLGPGAKRDVAEVTLHWQQYEGMLQDFQRGANDLYLKGNHVEGGVEAYARAVHLLEAWFTTGHGKALLSGQRAVPTK